MASRETLEHTVSARLATKERARDYLDYSVGDRQKPLKWKEVATPQLAGQLDRVLSKVTLFYGSKRRIPLLKRHRADVQVGTELTKLLNLIQVKPLRTRRADSPFVIHIRRPRVSRCPSDMRPYGVLRSPPRATYRRQVRSTEAL